MQTRSKKTNLVWLKWRNNYQAYRFPLTSTFAVCRIYAVYLAWTNLNPFTPSGIFYFISSGRSISYIRDVWLLFIIIIFFRNF